MVRFFLPLMLIAFGLCVGCSDDESAAVEPDITITNLGPPVILKTGISSGIVTPGETLTLWVVYSDPDGLDDLAGALFDDAATGEVYGPADHRAEGDAVVRLELSWSELTAVADVTTDTTRGFRATLWDRSGNSAQSAPVSVVLSCSGPSSKMCGGVCTNVSADEFNCGGCGVTCGTTACEAGVCRQPCLGDQVVCRGPDGDVCVSASTAATCSGGVCQVCPPGEACIQVACD